MASITAAATSVSAMDSARREFATLFSRHAGTWCERKLAAPRPGHARAKTINGRRSAKWTPVRRPRFARSRFESLENNLIRPNLCLAAGLGGIHGPGHNGHADSRPAQHWHGMWQVDMVP